MIIDAQPITLYDLHMPQGITHYFRYNDENRFHSPNR
jgi:hypothetical protein